MCLKKKTKLPSDTETTETPPQTRVTRPRTTGVRSAIINNLGSPTKERMRQAFQAQTAPSEQALKTIRGFLFHLSKNPILIIFNS